MHLHSSLWSANGLLQPRMELAERSHELTYLGWSPAGPIMSPSWAEQSGVETGYITK